MDEVIRKMIGGLSDVETLVVREGVLKIIDNWAFYDGVARRVDRAILDALRVLKGKGVAKPMYQLGEYIMKSALGYEERWKKDKDAALVEVLACRYLSTVKYYEEYNTTQSQEARHIMIERGLLPKKEM